MRFAEPDPDRGRLNEARHDGRRSARRGAGLSGILMGALLILLGFLIAVAVGVLTGFISPEQLAAPFKGRALPPPSAVSPPAAVEAASAGPAATPVVPATPQSRVTSEKTFGDWRFVCLETAPAATATCSAVQQLRVAETGAPVFVWRIAQDGHGGLIGLWQVPDTVLLAGGLTLDVGTAKPLVLPFESCGDGSCKVVANLAPDFIQALLNTKTLSASVALPNRKGLKFPLSANGLGDALVALQQSAQATDRSVQIT